MSYPLPSNEADFLALLGGMPYHRRNGYAIRLAMEHSSNPRLLTLIRELLATSPLPSKVPYPSQPSSSNAEKSETDGSIELRYPQTNASKRFVQRELGLSMATVIGKEALPILLEALVHPSNAGRYRAIVPCIEYASDDELVDVYRRCVPAVQFAIRLNLAPRVEVKRRLGISIPVPAKSVAGLDQQVTSVEPAILSLERQLQSCKLYEREDVWSKSNVLFSIRRLHRHLFNPEFVPKDSKKNLMEYLFELAERYPIPIRQNTPTSSFVLPEPFLDHLRSFYRYDLARTISLIQKFCYAIDCDGKGKDVLDLPRKFNIGKQGRNLWGEISLEQQIAVAEPFLTHLMEVKDGALLKNGELHRSKILAFFRWPIITSAIIKALPYLAPEKTTIEQRGHVLRFIVSGFSVIQSRLFSVTTVDKDVKREHQREMEKDILPLVIQTTDLLLKSLRHTAESDESMVQQLDHHFMQSLCLSHKCYYPIPRTLFNQTIGIFSMTQVSKKVLFDIAKTFFHALKPNVPTVFDIPNDGIVQPYDSMPETHNDDVLDVCISLYPPKWTLGESTYTKVLKLSPTQRDRIWDLINDPEFVFKYMNEKKRENLSILSDIIDLSPSPAARQPLMMALLKESESPAITKVLYAQSDISDPETRSALQKLTYTRVFEDRLPFYSALIEATTKSRNVKEWIKTLKWFIPRTKNEIPPDAERLPNLFPDAQSMVYVFKNAQEEEAKELVELFLGWEKQNNENVTPNWNLKKHLLAISQSCLVLLCGDVSSTLFQFGLDFAWTRAVNEKGLAHARSSYKCHSAIPTGNTPCSDEKDELARRKFLQSIDTKLGSPGHWRTTEEEKLVEKLYEQYEKVYDEKSFRDSPAYLPFLRDMMKVLGTRWVKVPRLVEGVDHAMDIIRQVKGTADKPAQWDGNGSTEMLRTSVSFVKELKTLYHYGFEKDSEWWWKEFRELRLFSTQAWDEVNLRYTECWDSENHRRDPDKLDQLVELLLGIHDSAVYISFVQSHLLESRQDLLKDHHIVVACSGVFNQVPKPNPPTWTLTTSAARQLFPHQCQLFANIFQETIHSVDKPLNERVYAAEQFTKLPTTTIHELAMLLKEDLNPRISEAVLMFLPHLDEPASGIQFLLAPVYLNGDLARTAVFGVNRSLESVMPREAAAMIAGAFPPADSGRYLKVTVAKEFARIICQYVQLPEVQKVVRDLWDRKLHQDVRVALLQSIMPLLDTPHEGLAWSIISDAVHNPKFQFDDTLFTLVAVRPRRLEDDDDNNDGSGIMIGSSRSGVDYVTLSSLPVLDNIAIATIPNRCCDKYVEEVLWPLAHLRLQAEQNGGAGMQSMSKYDKAKLNERIIHIRQGAYTKLFEVFLTRENAGVFARRALEDITHNPSHHSEESCSSNPDAGVGVSVGAGEPVSSSLPSTSISDTGTNTDTKVLLSKDSACPFCSSSTSQYVETQLDCFKLFLFLVNSITRCVVLDRTSTAWDSLVGVVDSLVMLVGSGLAGTTSPTRVGLLALNWLNAMDLGSKYFFETPTSAKARYQSRVQSQSRWKHDPMSLLDTLKKHLHGGNGKGVWELFSFITFTRRLQVFQNNVKRASLEEEDDSNPNDIDILSEASSLLTEIMTLARKYILDKMHTIKAVRMVLRACAGPPKLQAQTLYRKLFNGELGVFECVWQLDIKMEVLRCSYEDNETYARMLSDFHTHVALNEPAFYRVHWKAFGAMVKDVCWNARFPDRFSAHHEVVLNPILERDALAQGQAPGDCDRLLLEYLLEEMPRAFCADFGLGEWVLKRTSEALTPNTSSGSDPSFSVSSPSTSIARAVQFSRRLMSYAGQTRGNSDDKKDHLTLAQCLVAESVYFGTVADLDLKALSDIDDRSVTVISYPYFFSTDANVSGGDIEDRKGKSTVEGLEALYEERKAELVKKGRKERQSMNASTTTLTVLLRLYDFYPKLALAHPSLYIACLSLASSSSEPEMMQTSQKLITLLKNVLTSNKEGESGNKWGWVPPLMLGLSFVRKILGEIQEEVGEVSLDENWASGPGRVRVKMGGVEMLEWWRDTYVNMDQDGRQQEALKRLIEKEGYEELMREYEELKMIAWKDEDVVVKSKVIGLFMKDLGVKPVYGYHNSKDSSELQTTMN